MHRVSQALRTVDAAQHAHDRRDATTASRDLRQRPGRRGSRMCPRSGPIWTFFAFAATRRPSSTNRQSASRWCLPGSRATSKRRAQSKQKSAQTSSQRDEAGERALDRPAGACSAWRRSDAAGRYDATPFHAAGPRRPHDPFSREAAARDQLARGPTSAASVSTRASIGAGAATLAMRGTGTLARA